LRRGPYGAGDAVSIGNTGKNSCNLQRITSTWDEFSVTWNTQPTTTSINEVVLSESNFTIQDYLGVDVTQLVQDMVDSPVTSYGFKIVLQTEDPTRSLAFCSRDFSDSSKFPKLTLTYSCSKANNIISIHTPESERIYPNPTTGIINVKLEKDELLLDPTVCICDLTGKQLAFYNLRMPTTSFNLTIFPQGMYLYKIGTDNKLFSHGKIILQ